MHVLNIMYNRHEGGVEQVFADYCTILTQAGHQVTAMVVPDAAIIAVLEGKVPYITNRSIASSISHFNFYAVWRMRQYLCRLKPDIVLLHNARPLTFIQAAARGICPVVVVHHGGKEKRIKAAEQVICITRYMIESLKGCGIDPKRLHYIPNSITITHAFKGGKLLPRNELVIGAIGRFMPEKGFDILIEALRGLDIPYRAVVAGEGPEKERLKKLAEGLPIDFPGWVTYETKEAFFHQCNVLVVPSRAESFGLVILEAWHHSLPVVSTATKGGLELIEHGKTGVLVNIEDAGAIKEALRQLYHNSNQDLVKAAYDRCCLHYNRETVSPALLTLLEGLTWHISS